jgi:hypothetical protein
VLDPVEIAAANAREPGPRDPQEELRTVEELEAMNARRQLGIPREPLCEAARTRSGLFLLGAEKWSISRKDLDPSPDASVALNFFRSRADILTGLPLSSPSPPSIEGVCMFRLYSPRHLAALLAASCLVLLFAAPSVARTAAAEPTTAELTLAVSDFPDPTKVSKQRYVKAVAPATSTYSREFRSGTRIGSTFLVMLESEVSLYPTPALAVKDLQDFRRMLSTRAGRSLFAELLASGFRQSSKVKLKRVALSQPVSLGAGQSSVHVSATFVLANGQLVPVHLAYVQTDRALAALFMMPLGKRFPQADLRRLAKLQSDRFKRSFTIASVAVPTVTGVVTPAQTLTASPGDWSGAPGTYAYQWSRCDSTGTTCADIAGATAATYVVAAEDSGSLLRATVVASNSVSSSSATSAVTTPVA